MVMFMLQSRYRWEGHQHLLLQLCTQLVYCRAAANGPLATVATNNCHCSWYLAELLATCGSW